MAGCASTAAAAFLLTAIALFASMLWVLQQPVERGSIFSRRRSTLLGWNGTLVTSMLYRPAAKKRTALRKPLFAKASRPKHCGNSKHPFNMTRPVLPAEDEQADRYQFVLHEDAPGLAAKVARREPYNDFIFTTWQGNNAFARFWLSHLKAVNMSQHALMITYSREDCVGLPVDTCVAHRVEDMLEAMGQRNVPADNGGHIHGGGLAVVAKWTWSLLFVAAGYNVIFADTDVAFVRNPLHYFHRPEVAHFDVMGLSDWRLDNRPTIHCDRMLPDLSCQSTGLMYFRSTRKTISVLKEMVKEALPPRRKWEQLLWQKFIPRIEAVHQGQYQLLPVNKFMNMDHVKSDMPSVIAIHTGYIKGMCTKMHAFWCVGLGAQGLEDDVHRKCSGMDLR